MNNKYEKREIDRLRDELEITKKRLRHLLLSDFISSFDEVDRKGNYIRDIHEVDGLIKPANPTKKYIEVKVLGTCCKGCPEFHINSTNIIANGKCVIEKYECTHVERCAKIRANMKGNSNE